MAICKMCHKPIPDGMDFCEECENKRTNQADESYLDSLLSSVTAESEQKVENNIEFYERQNATPRRANFEFSHGVIKKSPVGDDSEPAPEAAMLDEIIGEAADEAVEEIPETAEEIVEEIPEAAEEIIEEVPEAVEEIAEEIPEAAEEIIEEVPETAEEVIEEIPEASEEIIEEVPEAVEEIVEESPEAAEEIIDEIPEAVEEIIEEVPEAVDEASEEIIEEVTEATEDIAEAADEGVEPTDDSDVDELLDGLLADMDAAGAGEPEEEPAPIGEDDLSDIFAAAQQQHEDENGGEDAGDGETPADDLFDISEPEGEPASDEAGEAAPDVGEEPIVDILDGEAGTEPAAAAEEEPIVDILDSDITDAVLDIPEPEAVPAEEELPGPDIEIELPEPETGEGGEQLVDAANVDAVLDDILNTGQFLSEADLENSDNEPEPEVAAETSEEPLTDIGGVDVDSLLDDLDSGNLDKTIETLDADAQEKKKSKKKKDKEKKSLFTRLFANVVEELTPEQIEAQKAKEEAAAKKKIEDAEKKKAQKALSKEEKEKQKADEKAAKEEAAKKKAEEKKRKAEEAKLKAQKKKEEKLTLESLEVNEGRINRAGASILFVIFAVFAIFIILGTNIYYYNLSIKNAQTEFDRQHYNEAYYEVYGLRIKDKDIELYDKIMTVMYVNIQLSSYQNYMKSNNREKALDSLLKGLIRYDKYLELATLLDIEDDLNYVKSGILDALASEFQMSESDAYDMMKYVDNIDYSAYIYELLGDYEVDYQ